jgi:glycosyltransferase involved in cell wall biosynthesis
MKYKTVDERIPFPDKGGVRGGFTLGIDLRCLPASGSEGAGIAHAARALTRALIRTVPTNWMIRLYLPQGAALESLSVDRVLLQGSRRKDLVRGLQESPCDILFVPSGAVALGLPVPAIPWVHDVDIYAHPEWFGESWVTRMRTTWMFRKGLEKAPLIFSVSEYTKSEIRNLGLGIGKKVIVTGEGGDETLAVCSDEDRQHARERLRAMGIIDRFILMLGTVEPRKNIPFALSILQTKNSKSPIDFIIAGKDGWKTEFINKAIDHASKSINLIRLKEVPEALRRDLLISASVILVPSLSEGFGLVALEGIQAGVSVLASNRSALPEIVGDTALSLDDANEWELVINHLLTDGLFRSDWIKRQKRSASRYSWKAAAETVWSQLKSLDSDIQN